MTHCCLQTDKDQQESRAVAGKPHVRCRCKIRYVSKFTAASRGSSLRDSMAFLFFFSKIWRPSRVMITECHISWVAMLRPAQLPMPVGYTVDWSVHYVWLRPRSHEHYLKLNLPVEVAVVTQLRLQISETAMTCFTVEFVGCGSRYRPVGYVPLIV